MPPIKSGETLSTDASRIEITPTDDAPLPEGTHTFELVVEDDRGRKSPPAFITVIVQRTLPRAVPEGPEKEVELGEPFTLSAERSSAVEGDLASYSWRLVPPDEAEKI